MSEQSERAKKAALTKAHRQALQELADKKLIESTSGKRTLLRNDSQTYDVSEFHAMPKPRH
jgi:DNA-binding FadR family transcriptional regulator